MYNPLTIPGCFSTKSHGYGSNTSIFILFILKMGIHNWINLTTILTKR